MKIAFVVSRYGPWGGVVMNVRETSIRLRERGDEVEIFAGQPRGATGTPAQPDPEPVPLPVRRFPYGPSERVGFPLMVGLTEALARSGADVVHAHMHRSGYVLQAAQAARRAGVPLVVSTHFHPAHRRDPRVKRVALRLMDLGFGLMAYGHASALITETEFEAAQVRPFAFAATVHVIPPGLDLGQWADPATDRRDPRLPPEYFVYAGRIYWDKGLDHLLRAVALLPPSERRPIVLVGQDEGFRAKLEALAAKLGLSHLLIFLGYVDRATYRGAIRGAKALVLPSEWEAYGFVLLDAMAAGVPVIASRVGAVPYVLEEGRYGVLVPFGDPPALARALQAVDEDREGTRRRVEAASQHVRSFDWSTCTAAFRSVYEEVTRR